MQEKNMEQNRISGASMRTLLSHTREMMFMKDLNFVYIGASQSFAELAGWSGPEDLIGKTDFEIFQNEELAKRYRDDDERMLRKGEPLLEYVEPIPSPDGGSRYCTTSKYIIADDNGEPIGMLGVSRDITREYAAKLNYERELGYLFVLPDNALFSILLDVTSWRIVDFRCRNENDQVVSKYDTIEAFAKNAAASVVADEKIRGFIATISQTSMNRIFESGKRHLTLEYLRQMADGTQRWVKEDLHFLTDPVSGHLSVLFVLQDVDKEKREQDALLLAAQHDSMTGLLNHDAIMRKISNFLKREGVGKTHALMMLDIDNFKAINDTCGHQFGDQVLRNLSGILQSRFRDTDLLGRVGGDEFFVFMINTDGEDSVRKKAGELIQALQYNSFWEETKIRFSCSIGVGMVPERGKSLKELYAEADAALYQAKSRGKNQYVIFGASEETETRLAPAIRPRPKTRISERELQWQIASRLIVKDYEFVSLIDVETDLVLTCKTRNAGVYFPTAVNTEFQAQAEAFAAEAILTRDRADFIKAMSIGNVTSMLKQREQYVTSFAVKLPNGQVCDKEWRCLWLNASRKGLILTRRDAGEFMMTERDTLTGLYNRQAFCRRVRECLNADPDTEYLIVRWDIDRFKFYNDTYGSEAGDRLLREIGVHLLNGSDSGCVFGHFEADHFVGFLPREGSRVEIWDLLQSKFLQNYQKGFRLNVSVGVYPIHDPSVDVSRMCDRALLALRTVKNSYGNKVATYDDQMRREILEEQELLDDFDQAIRENQFQLYFQPQVNYDDGCLCGAEALVRWNHPRRGLIQPGGFVPLFEKKGYISRLDEHVWEKSCQYLRSWLDRNGELPGISVSVNLSRIDIYNPKLSKKLLKLVEKYGLSPASLRLEITESAYMENPEQLINAVKSLQNAGFMIEMDDFGAGYSSLNTLKDVPVDILKLDVRFLSKGADDSRGGNILSSVLRMAHWLRLPVIAEGVESKEYADYLKSIGCVYMQGYYFARPLPAEEFEGLLKESRIDYADRYQNVSMEGMSAFWDASAQTTLLFNSFVGGAAIIEYRGGEVEILRANDKFYREINSSRMDYLPRQMRTLERFDPENRAKYIAMLEESIRTGGEAECEIQSLPHRDGEIPFWTHNRVRLLANNVDSHLFYLLTENITRRRAWEEQAKEQIEKLRDDLNAALQELEKLRGCRS